MESHVKSSGKKITMSLRIKCEKREHAVDEQAKQKRFLFSLHARSVKKENEASQVSGVKRSGRVHLALIPQGTTWPTLWFTLGLITSGRVLCAWEPHSSGNLFAALSSASRR